MVNQRNLSKRKKEYIGGDANCAAKPEYFYDKPYYSDTGIYTEAVDELAAAGAISKFSETTAGGQHILVRNRISLFDMINISRLTESSDFTYYEPSPRAEDGKIPNTLSMNSVHIAEAKLILSKMIDLWNNRNEKCNNKGAKRCRVMSTDCRHYANIVGSSIYDKYNKCIFEVNALKNHNSKVFGDHGNKRSRARVEQSYKDFIKSNKPTVFKLEPVKSTISYSSTPSRTSSRTSSRSLRRTASPPFSTLSTPSSEREGLLRGDVTVLLAPNWKKDYDENGDVFYINNVTNEVQGDTNGITFEEWRSRAGERVIAAKYQADHPETQRTATAKVNTTSDYSGTVALTPWSEKGRNLLDHLRGDLDFMKWYDSKTEEERKLMIEKAKRAAEEEARRQEAEQRRFEQEEREAQRRFEEELRAKKLASDKKKKKQEEERRRREAAEEQRRRKEEEEEEQRRRKAAEGKAEAGAGAARQRTDDGRSQTLNKKSWGRSLPDSIYRGIILIWGYAGMEEPDTLPNRAQLRKAYRKAALAYHPDRNSQESGSVTRDVHASDRYTEIFSVISSSYEQVIEQYYDKFGISGGVYIKHKSKRKTNKRKTNKRKTNKRKTNRRKTNRRRYKNIL